jgi:hypothetical protein
VKRRKQARSRLFLASFVVVFSLLVGGAIILAYLTTRPVVFHIPSTLPAYGTLWSSYAPAQALQFTFRNYTAIRTLNSSLYARGTLFTTLAPAYSLNTEDVSSLISVVFSEPNATVDIAFVSPSSFMSFSGLLQSSGLKPSVEGGAKLYFTQLVGTNGFVSGWLLTIPSTNAIGFSEGISSARTVIGEVLGVGNGTVRSIFSRTDVTQMFYATGGPNGHLAFTVENFPGLVNTGEMTLQTVDYNQSMVRSSYLVKFDSPDRAISQFDFVKQEYFASQYFAIYDQYVLAQKTQPLSALFEAVQSVG